MDKANKKYAELWNLGMWKKHLAKGNKIIAQTSQVDASKHLNQSQAREQVKKQEHFKQVKSQSFGFDN